MAFKNEYIPPLEQETSEFLKEARLKLRTGHSKHDDWTVDREDDMVLQYRGCGHEDKEAAKTEYWQFIDCEGLYCFDTYLESKIDISETEVAIKRRISFPPTSGFDRPDADTIAKIKEALRVTKDFGVISKYESCQLVLVDTFSGNEL